MLPETLTFKRVFLIRWGQERGLFSCRIDPTASRPIQPRAAPLPRRAPPRPDPPVVCPAFGLGRFRMIAFSNLVGTQEICFLAEPNCEGTIRPSLAALLCAFLPRLGGGMSGLWSGLVNSFFPGHALHEKGLRRQIGVGTLVSSQERRTFLVLLINR